MKKLILLYIFALTLPSTQVSCSSIIYCQATEEALEIVRNHPDSIELIEQALGVKTSLNLYALQGTDILHEWLDAVIRENLSWIPAGPLAIIFNSDQVDPRLSFYLTKNGLRVRPSFHERLEKLYQEKKIKDETALIITRKWIAAQENKGPL